MCTYSKCCGSRKTLLAQLVLLDLILTSFLSNNIVCLVLVLHVMRIHPLWFIIVSISLLYYTHPTNCGLFYKSLCKVTDTRIKILKRGQISTLTYLKLMHRLRIHHFRYFAFTDFRSDVEEYNKIYQPFLW